MGEPSSFSIIELTGPKNSLVLKGRALPYRPFTLAGGMRAEFVWYPGNPRASIQVLGSDEKGTTINGMWKDKFIKSFTDPIPLLGIPAIPVIGQPGIAEFNGQPLGDVFDIVRVVDGFRRRGQLIEVGWDAHIRQGILANFKHSWLRREDVEWEMEFMWASQGEPFTPISFGIAVPGLEIANELRAALREAQLRADAPFSVVASVQNRISDAFDELESAVATVRDISEKVVQGILGVIAGARLILAALETVKDEAGNVDDAVISLPARGLRNVPDITTLTQQEAVEAEVYSRQLRLSTHVLQTVAVLRGLELAQSTTNEEIVATFIARQGEDLRDVSTRFYGTPEEWKRIASFNGASGSGLDARQVVLVPKLTIRGDC